MLNTATRTPYGQCSVLLFDPQTDTRHQTADALSAMGFRYIDEARDARALERAYCYGAYDLMIGDAGGRQEGICETVRNARNHALGKDPFLGVILTTWSPTMETVRRAMNSGSDHVLAKPFTPKQVSSRVKAIVDARPPFVVTLDYVGPDRRQDTARASAVELVKVPNSLRAKVRDEPAEMATPETIKAVMAQINRQKISRYDLQIGILIELISRSLERNKAPGSRSARFRKLLFLIDDLTARIADTGFGQATKLCGSLVMLIHEIARMAKPAPDRFEILEQTAMALHLCFNPGRSADQMSQEVTDAVNRIERRNTLPIS